MRNSTQTLSTRANENLISFNPLTRSIFTKAILVAVFSLATSFQLLASTFTVIQNGDWSTPAVWAITNPTPGATNTIPGPSDDVIMPAGYSVNLDVSSSCNNLKLDGSLYFDNNGKKLTVFGDTEFSGMISMNNLLLQANRTFTFKGSSNMPMLTYGNVVIDIPVGTDITTNVISKTASNNYPVIQGSLTVISGNLKINSFFDITGMNVSIINPTSSITFGGIAAITRANNFISLSQGGRLIMENIGKGQGLKRQGDVLFPVGTLNGTYTPAIINNKEFNPATVNGSFGVTVVNGVYQNGTDGPLVMNNVVNKTWVISLINGDSDASITFKWNAADELPDFTASNSKIAAYTNNRWSNVPGTTLDPVNRTIKQTGVLGSVGTTPGSPAITFPLFAIQGGLINPLPVELVSFNAVKKNNEVALTWETASEKNCRGFEVQSSTDGKNYEALDFVPSLNGNATYNQRYAYTDKAANKEGLVYYRLKQIDLDGTVAFYNAKVVDLGRFNNVASVYPNPFQEAFKVNMEATGTETAQVMVSDITGKVLYTTEHDLVKGANILDIDLNNQTAGLYLLKVTTGNQTYTNRLVKQ